MERNNRNNRKRRNRWNNQKNNSRFPQNESSKKQKFHFVPHEDVESRRKREAAIRELKEREVICPKCGQPIADLSSAIADKSEGAPVHFDCILGQIAETEPLRQNERISYIGQGRFAILYFENPKDQRHFTIRKVIEWEGRDKKPGWRDEMSGLYSQVE
ncbi:MAG: hypothetical protein K2H09_01410 [Treponemataceae bacterium]|nr:hypothetical protein [Treponemataceae bacterium]